MHNKRIGGVKPDGLAGERSESSATPHRASGLKLNF
jgi:hypothetical protein